MIQNLSYGHQVLWSAILKKKLGDRKLVTNTDADVITVYHTDIDHFKGGLQSFLGVLNVMNHLYKLLRA